VIFAARLVLFSASVVFFFTAFYIVVSVIQRMRRQQWSRRAGPFESELAEAEAEEELEDVDPMFSLLEEAWTENENLLARLEERDAARARSSSA
jgi:hypothetical protein